MMTRRDIGKGSFSLLAAMGLSRGADAAGGKTVFEIAHSEEEWRKILTTEQFHVLRKHGTERPYSSPLDKHTAAGAYHCAGCDLPLFSSETKYDSRTGWPSFWKPLDNAIGTTEDRSLFMTRTEVHCRRCGGHLGHVFDDGPKPTGLRYCMNGVSLKFVPKPAA
ncbi:MAG: peptide-methionine (R)-S-oxide reductase MsrB [Hyphomicrobiaceae bacterium]